MAIDPELQLDDTERAYLAMMVANIPAFGALTKIFEAEIEKFKVALINAQKPEDVITQHNLAKAASQFYVQVINRINQEIEIHHHTPKVNDQPVDATEGLLDLGDLKGEIDDRS